MKKYIYILLLLFSAKAFSQEIVTPLKYNPAIRQELHKNPDVAAKQSAVTLHLPFTDDFSSGGIYPDPSKWLDNKVFVNSTLPRRLPTVGAVTFDGLDETGSAYIPGATGSGSADVLTSQPLFLSTKPLGGNYTAADSIYISFFYEKKGYGDAPEATDSLVLEFYDPTAGTWTKEWHVNGGISSGNDTIFTQVDVLIDAAYYQDNFQFRFRNYGNLSGALDYFHVDYIRVYATAGVTSAIIDQAFTNPRTSDLSVFTSVPWKHYKGLNDPSTILKDSAYDYYEVYQTSSNVNAGFNHRAYSFDNDLIGSVGSPSALFPTVNNQRLQFGYPLNYIYPKTEEISDDSSYFILKDYYTTQLGAGDIIKTNDTVTFRQDFYNYYSYDDGTCELAYDLINAANGKVAMKFDMLQQDTLRGVQIFFAQQNADVSNKQLTIKVWSSLSPEVVLYQVTNQFPLYYDSINGYATYVFPTPVVATSFYIGFAQTSPDGLHLGFDRNTTSNSKMYYNTSGTWSQVAVLPGTFMIRPLVGSQPLVIVEEEDAAVSFSCFPNPSSGEVNIYSSAPGEIRTLYITDVEGKVVYEDEFHQGRTDLSFLAPGLYMINLNGSKNYAPQKLIISR